MIFSLPIPLPPVSLLPLAIASKRKAATAKSAITKAQNATAKAAAIKAVKAKAKAPAPAKHALSTVPTRPRPKKRTRPLIIQIHNLKEIKEVNNDAGEIIENGEEEVKDKIQQAALPI